MKQDQNQKNGFSGLSTLLSDTESDLALPTNFEDDNLSSKSNRSHEANDSTPTSRQISQSEVTPKAQISIQTITPTEPVADPSTTTQTNKSPPKGDSQTWKIVAAISISIAAVLAIEKFGSYIKSSSKNTQQISENETSSTSRTTPKNSGNQNRQQNEIRKVVIASIAANIRERPDVKSKIIGSYKKGEKLVYAGVTDNFTNIRLHDGRIGYIVSDLVIPEIDFARLEGLRAAQYIEIPGNKTRLNNFVDGIQSNEEKIGTTIQRVIQRDAGVHLAIHEIENHSPSAMPIDEPAGVWYSNLARAANSYKNLEEASLCGLASIMGNPLNPDSYVAWGLTNHSLGRGEALSLAAYALLALSPRTTNTWMIVGLAEAMSNKQNHNDTLATGAFILAIKFSRNQTTTRKFYKDLISTSNNPRVQRLISDALIEEAANPTLFEE